MTRQTRQTTVNAIIRILATMRADARIVAAQAADAAEQD